MLVVWLLLTFNLVLVHSSGVQICDKDAAAAGNCTLSETSDNGTTTTTVSTTTVNLSTTISSVPETTASSGRSPVTTEPSLVNSTSTPIPDEGPTTQKPQVDLESSKNSNAHGRAINFNMPEHRSTDSTLSAEKGSLQDLSLDDIDETSIMPDKANSSAFNATISNIEPNTSTTSTSTQRPTSTTVAANGSLVPMSNGSSCMQGQTFERGCSEKCECGPDGKSICRPRCSMPFFRRGARINDPTCIEKPSEDDPCCSLMVCTHDTETEPLEGCTFKNQSYQRGDTINDGCLAVCTCGKAGQVLCKPRCPPVANNSSTDRCVELPDPTDPCCKVVLCDVTLGDHDVSKAGVEEVTPAPHLQLLFLEVVNKTSVRLGLAGEPQEHHDNVTVEASLDQKTWSKQKSEGLVVMGLEPSKTYYLRAKSGSLVSNAVEVSLPSADVKHNEAGCMYKGKHYMLEEEFHDACDAYCACTDSGVQCATIECPTDFGLDVVDPNCVDWETHPPDFKPSPPNCCPEQVRCRNNGSCMYEGQMFNNWAEIPLKLTGCAKRCYCEFGNVTCQSTCPPVTATPPSDLQCGPQQAILNHLPGDECCLYWMCPQVQHTGTNLTMMHERPTEQRQSENKTAMPGVSSQPPGLKKPAGTPGHTFLPLNPDYLPEGLLPLLEPIEEEHKNHSMKHQHSIKNDSTKSPTKKPQPVTYHPPLDLEEEHLIPTHIPHQPNQIEDHFMPTLVPNVNHTVHQGLQHYSNKSHNHSNEDGKHPPYHVKPPFLPDYEDENIEDYDEPNIWVNQPTGQKKQHPERPHHDQNPSHRYPQGQNEKNIPNHVNPGEYFVHPNQKPGPDSGEIYHIQAVPNSAGPQRPPPGQHLDAADPHLEQILAHLQRQGILPQHYTILQHEGPPPPQQQGQQNDSKNRPDSRPVHENIADIPIHIHPGRLPPQYHQGYVPKPIPRPGQIPYHQQGLIPPPHPNDPRLPHQYPNQPGRHPDNDGPVPYQGLLGQQYQGVSHIPPHVDIDHLLLTANGRHNQSQPGFPHPQLPPGFQPQPPHQDEITVHTLEAVDENTVRLVFSVPPVLVGLHGRVELRYTSDKLSSDPSTWSQQVLAPPGDLIATPQLEFELGELQPDTQYKIKITVILRDLHNSPSSKILTVHTPPPATPTTTLPPQIPVDVGLSVVEVNSTWARLIWRKFTEFELQFVDGVQLRYKELDGKVYAATPLIHRAVTTYTIEDLRPHTQYEVGIFFIPFPGQTTELISERTTDLTTADVHDLYKFNVTLDVQHIKSTSVELSWSGVPYPEDKYVNIFRAIYQSDAGKEDFNTFKVAKRDSQARTLIQDLKPGTRYRMWLEVYLTNGKIKKSNVQDFMTKPGSVPSVGATQQGKLKGEGPEPLVEKADYYGPLVAVAIIAALAIVAALILLLILMRKHGTNKAAISATRKTQSAYDNPSYKTSENDPAAAANGGTGAKTVEQP